MKSVVHSYSSIDLVTMHFNLSYLFYILAYFSYDRLGNYTRI